MKLKDRTVKVFKIFEKGDLVITKIASSDYIANVRYDKEQLPHSKCFTQHF